VFIGVTLASLLAIILLLPYRTYAENTTDTIYYNHLVLNIIINFLLIIIFFFFVLRLLDVKERKNRNEKKLVDIIFSTSQEAVFVADPVTMLITRHNEKATELFGLSVDNMLNYSMEKILGDRIVNKVKEVFANGDKNNNWQGDTSFIRKNNFPFHGFVNIVLFEYTEQLFVKISILDITSVKAAEVQALEAKAKAENAALAKTRFMSNMSHELRTPLNAIIGTTHLLMEENNLLCHNDHFKVLKSSSEHMLHLVNEVLDFGKLEAGKLELSKEPFDLAVLFKEIADSFAPALEQKNIELFTEIDELPPETIILGDEMRFKQVFLNLISNAIKFTPSGSITLQSNIKKITSTNAEIYFAVIDTGIGIPSDKLHLIFNSFTQADAETTRKYGGSGLGLSICKELVLQMGGDLQVASEEEEGSRFYFTLNLPLQQKAKTNQAEDEIKKTEQLTGIKILLAEDNPLNMKIAKRFLDNWGALVFTAENGKIGWDLFQIGEYDILLIDLEMPEMDGKQLLSEIRKVNKEIPAIAFTAAVYENMQEDLRMYGFTGYLRKPFQPYDLNAVVLKNTERKQIKTSA
jgi:signal transduction histidine kinase